MLLLLLLRGRGLLVLEATQPSGRRGHQQLLLHQHEQPIHFPEVVLRSHRSAQKQPLVHPRQRRRLAPLGRGLSPTVVLVALRWSSLDQQHQLT